MENMGFLALPCIGFLIGVVIISLGGGGGGFYVGILTAFFDVPPAVAAATSLATIIPTTTIGSYSHWKAGNVNLRIGAIMMSGAAVGAVIGSYFSGFMPAFVYTKVTGGLLLILSIQMLISILKKRKQDTTKVTTKTGGVTVANVATAVCYGFLGGVMSGLVGISGTGPIIAGLTVLGCGALETVGTSVFVLVAISVSGFFMHLGMGNVDWPLVGQLVIGTMSGAFLAPVILKKMNRATMERVLPPILMVMVFIMGLIVFMK